MLNMSSISDLKRPLNTMIHVETTNEKCC